MFEWSEELLMVRDAVRTFVDTEIRPHREELEHGDLPPYDLLRKLYKTFGMVEMAADSFDRKIAEDEAQEGGSSGVASDREAGTEPQANQSFAHGSQTTPPSGERDRESRGGFAM